MLAPQLGYKKTTFHISRLTSLIKLKNLEWSEGQNQDLAESAYCFE